MEKRVFFQFIDVPRSSYTKKQGLTLFIYIYIYYVSDIGIKKVA